MFVYNRLSSLHKLNSSLRKLAVFSRLEKAEWQQRTAANTEQPNRMEKVDVAGRMKMQTV